MSDKIIPILLLSALFCVTIFGIIECPFVWLRICFALVSGAIFFAILDIIKHKSI